MIKVIHMSGGKELMKGVCGYLVDGFSLPEAETSASAEEDVTTEAESRTSVEGNGEVP